MNMHLAAYPCPQIQGNAIRFTVIRRGKHAFPAVHVPFLRQEGWMQPDHSAGIAALFLVIRNCVNLDFVPGKHADDRRSGGQGSCEIFAINRVEFCEV